MVPKFNLKITNLIEPYRVFLNQTNIMLSMKLTRENPFVTQEQKGFGCHEILMSTPFDFDSVKLFDGNMNLGIPDDSQYMRDLIGEYRSITRVDQFITNEFVQSLNDFKENLV